MGLDPSLPHREGPPPPSPIKFPGGVLRNVRRQLVHVAGDPTRRRRPLRTHDPVDGMVCTSCLIKKDLQTFGAKFCVTYQLEGGKLRLYGIEHKTNSATDLMAHTDPSTAPSTHLVTLTV